MPQGATEVLAAVHSLFRAIESFSVPDIQARYLKKPRLLIFLEGPGSKVEGWDQRANEAGWRELLEKVTFHEIRLDEDVRAGRDHNLGWVAGTVRLTYSRFGEAEPSVETWNRGTRILERHGGEWLIAFEHVSFPLPDPYPTP